MTDLSRRGEADRGGETAEALTAVARRNSEALATFGDRIFAVAQASAVFSAPVTAGEYTVITASELMAGGGFGSGFGTTPPQPAGAPSEAAGRRSAGSGGGGGGGGGARARPVAAIVIGPKGVTVRPVVDATQLGLAALAAFGALFAFGRRFRRR